MSDKLSFQELINSDQLALAHNLKIQGVPTLVLFHQGKSLWRQAGVLSLQQLDHIVDAHRPKATA